MRRATGEGSIYQRASDGRWVGVVDLGWVGGKRVRRTVTARTLRELRPKFRALKARIEKGVISDEMTVGDWLDYWMAHVAPGRCRQRTLDGYRGYVSNYLKPHLGKRKLVALRPDHVRAMLAAMSDAGLSIATQRQAYAILHRALVVAEREGRVDRNAAGLIDPPQVPTNHHTPLTLTQARIVIAALDGDPLAARWLCALLEGMRQGECLGLRWDDVDLPGRRIHVRYELVRLRGKGLVLTPPKSDTSTRVLPMLEPVAYALGQTERRGEFVFYGRPMDPRADWQAWKELLIRAGVADPGAPMGQMPALHAARGTTASLLDEAGVSLKVIAEILGHASVQVTQTAYIHGDDERRRAAMDSLHALILGPASDPGRR